VTAPGGLEAGAAVLHVEDDPVDHANLRRSFARCGFRHALHWASNGEDALALLRRAGGDAPRPRLIVLDLGMPLMNGLEFLEAAKADQDLRPIPVVVFTASRHDNDLRRAYELGAAGYLVKPIDLPAFAEAAEVLARYWTLCEVP
jgi:CheY-like chemotaxis protein